MTGCRRPEDGRTGMEASAQEKAKSDHVVPDGLPAIGQRALRHFARVWGARKVAHG